MKAQEIQDYIVSNYGHVRHDINSMEVALQVTADEFEVDIKELFHFVIENVPMKYTHSYGFHTAYGRELMDTFKSEYYKECRQPSNFYEPRCRIINLEL